MHSSHLLMVLLLAAVATGCAGRARETVDIDRKTYSLSLPKGWTEDTKDELHDPDSFTIFENEDSCLFNVIVGKKSTGASVESLLESHKRTFEKKFTDTKSTEFKEWSNYEGKGVQIEGKVQGFLRARVSVFGFERGDNVCVVIEFATLADHKKYSADFDIIRQTFKIK